MTKTKDPTPLDVAIDVFHDVAALMEPLTQNERARVIQALAAFYNVDV